MSADRFAKLSSTPRRRSFGQRSAPAQRRIDFMAINQAALASMPSVLQRLLPGGQLRGREYVALNPTRADRHLGSFKINIDSGRWIDNANGDKGGDVVSLVAYIKRLPQGRAARHLADILGLRQ